MSAINDRSTADADVAQRLADFRLIDALDRFNAREPVEPEEIPFQVGGEQREYLIRRMLDFARDYGHNRVSRDALELELRAIYIHMVMVGWFQGLSAGLDIRERDAH